MAQLGPGKEQALTLLRQSVRYAVRTEQSIVEKKRQVPEIRALLPRATWSPA